jgi:hypothetical protein
MRIFSSLHPQQFRGSFQGSLVFLASISVGFVPLLDGKFSWRQFGLKLLDLFLSAKD